MSEHSTPEERTEMPTDRRMEQLRKEGAIHHSTEFEQTLSLITGVMIVTAMAPLIMGHLQEVFVKAFGMIANTEPLTVQALKQGFIGLLRLLGPYLILIVLCIAAVASLSVLLQTRWNMREKKIKFDFKMLNPINGVKRVFSLNGLMQLGKALLKLAIILPIGFFSLKMFAPQMVQLMHMEITEIFSFTGKAMSSIFWKIVYVLIAISVFDFFYGKWQWLRSNKMTKEEVKDERKSIEGDEETKRAIARKGLARIAQRLRETVPTADVVVTNPTHYAVALKYDRDSMAAPIVVAKGKNFIALRIREIARENGIPVLERKPLARALFASVEIGAIIPRDLFKAVAEVLAYVYRLKNPYRQMQNSRR